MADEQFDHDVFISHSSKDKPIVVPLAERLRADGLRVWLDEWEIKPGDHIPVKIEHGLESSRVLLFCMSTNAFGSDWVTLESQAFRFRDPLNTERRLLPLRLDDAEIRNSLRPFSYVSWLPKDREQAYPKLVQACRPSGDPVASTVQATHEQGAVRTIQLDFSESVCAFAFSPRRNRALTGGADNIVRLWDLETGRCLSVLRGHTDEVWTVAWGGNGHHVLSGGNDGTVRLWDLETQQDLRVLEGHTGFVQSVAWSAEKELAISGAHDMTVRLWDLATGKNLRVFEGHSGEVWNVAWSSNHLLVLSAARDDTIRLWDLEKGSCIGVLEGHTADVNCVTWDASDRRAISGSDDETLRLWDVQTGECIRVFRGHSSPVWSVSWSPGQRLVLSASLDGTLRLWDVETARCLRILEGHATDVYSVAWDADGQHAFSGDTSGEVRVWDLSTIVDEARIPQAAPLLVRATDQVQYTNAKVLLVGESGAGKTGLSTVLAGKPWRASDSTVGAWATQWAISAASNRDGSDGVEREVWLWDFGGQADQRLIHQLYMDDTAVAVLVFDGQKADVFETLGQWDRDLTRASRRPFTKLLAAGRVDAGGLRVSKSRLEAFAKERGFSNRLFETSAKFGADVEELKQAICDGIRWADIPWRTSPLLFKRLKEEVVRLKDEGRVLMRFNELRETLHLRLLEQQAGDVQRFEDEELKAVVGLLAGPGAVWELSFGGWVLLQPELINAYAQAVIQTMRADPHERGCILEERVLNGDLTYHSSMQRLGGDDERFVLLAMHQMLLERGVCLREQTDDGPMLVFPSLYRRERPDLVGHPAVHVSYQFNGFLDDVYATLVVRLHYTASFDQDQLWRNAADFKTLTGRKLGVKLNRRAEGAGEIEVYFDPSISAGEKIIFSKFVYDHLLQKSREVVRLRHFICPHCGTPVGNRDVAMERLEAWRQDAMTKVETTALNRRRRVQKQPTILCAKCERRVPLWDEMEQRFVGDEARRQVRELERQTATELERESRERALIADVIATATLAGQRCRELTEPHHGIDMEIEFLDDAGQATGDLVYVIAKSAVAYHGQPGREAAGTFRIADQAHARFWLRQVFPVVLVNRNERGEVRWMDVREPLRRASNDGRAAVQRIAFTGERLDVMTVRRWRQQALGLEAP